MHDCLLLSPPPTRTHTLFIMGVISNSNSFLYSLEQDSPELVTKVTPESVGCEDHQAEGADCHLVPTDGDLEMPERSCMEVPAETTGCFSLDDQNDSLNIIDNDGRNANSKGSLQNHSFSDKDINITAAVNQAVVDPSLNQENGTLTCRNFAAVSGECRSPKDLSESTFTPSVSLSENGEFGLSKDLSKSTFTGSGTLSENGLHSAREPDGIEIGNSKAPSNPPLSLSSVGAGPKFIDVNSGKDENAVDINVSSSMVDGPAESGVICLYQCCPQCLHRLYHLTKKLLVHELGLNDSHWTVEDVHDAVASLSADLISAIRKVYLAEDFTDLSNKTLRHGNHGASLECSNLGTCNPKNPGVPAECISHSTSHSATGSKDMAVNEALKLDFKFIFRDGVLVHMDPDKDVSLFCKVEALCLCSVRELIVMTKRPFD